MLARRCIDTSWRKRDGAVHVVTTVQTERTIIMPFLDWMPNGRPAGIGSALYSTSSARSQIKHWHSSSVGGPPIEHFFSRLGAWAVLMAPFTPRERDIRPSGPSRAPYFGLPSDERTGSSV